MRRIDKEELEKLVPDCISKTDLLKQLDITPNPRNLKTIAGMLEYHNIPYGHFDRYARVKEKQEYIPNIQTKECPKCSTPFEVDYNAKYQKSFCSRKCANSREWDEEDNLKKSESAKITHKDLKELVQLFKENNQELDQDILYSKIISKRTELLLSKPIEQLTEEEILQRLIIKQNYKCNSCNQSTHLNKPIILSIYIDDLDPASKEAICSNCRDIKTFKPLRKVEDQQLLFSLIKNQFNIKKALEDLNLAPKGDNYQRCHDLIKEVKGLIY